MEINLKLNWTVNLELTTEEAHWLELILEGVKVSQMQPEAVEFNQELCNKLMILRQTGDGYERETAIHSNSKQTRNG